MWYLLLLLFFLIGMSAFIILSKWSIELFILPESAQVTVKLFCFTKKLTFPSSEKKNKKQKKKQMTQEKKREESNNDTHISQSNKELHLLSFLEKIRICKAKTLAYKSLVFQCLSCLRNHIEIRNTYLRLDFGSGDAATTGQMIGYFWMGAGILYPLLSRYFLIDFPVIHITPDFYQKRLDYELKSIIKVKPVHIIKTLFVLVFGYFNIKNKGSVTNG